MFIPGTSSTFVLKHIDNAICGFILWRLCWYRVKVQKYECKTKTLIMLHVFYSWSISVYSVRNHLGMLYCRSHYDIIASKSAIDMTVQITKVHQEQKNRFLKQKPKWNKILNIFFGSTSMHYSYARSMFISMHYLSTYELNTIYSRNFAIDIIKLFGREFVDCTVTTRGLLGHPIEWLPI